MTKTIMNADGGVMSVSEERLKKYTAEPIPYSTGMSPWIHRVVTSTSGSFTSGATTSTTAWPSWTLPAKPTSELTEEEQRLVGEVIAEEIAAGRAKRDTSLDPFGWRIYRGTGSTTITNIKVWSNSATTANTVTNGDTLTFNVEWDET